MSTVPCPFCQRIASGEVIEYPEFRSVMFPPLNPVTMGHVLFVPERHVEHPRPFWTAAAVGAAEAWAARMDEDYNLITSSGVNSTMTVGHIHVHYVPRRKGDGLLLPWGGVK